MSLDGNRGWGENKGGWQEKRWQVGERGINQSLSQSGADQFIPISPENARHLCHNSNQSISGKAAGRFTIWFTQLIPHFYTPRPNQGSGAPAKISWDLSKSRDGISRIVSPWGSCRLMKVKKRWFCWLWYKKRIYDTLQRSWLIFLFGDPKDISTSLFQWKRSTGLLAG